MKEQCPDLVIHLAARAVAELSNDFVKEYMDTNFGGTLNVLSAMKAAGVPRIIYFSSASVLGSGSMKKEHDPFNPQSVYALSKVNAEWAIRHSGVNNVILRPFTLFGLHGRQDQVFYKWIRLVKQGKPIEVHRSSRGFTHIDDLVDAVVKCVHSDLNEVTINLGDPRSYELHDVFDMFFTLCKRKKRDVYVVTDLVDAPIRDSSNGSSRAKIMLGWNPKRDLAKELWKIVKAEL